MAIPSAIGAFAGQGLSGLSSMFSYIGQREANQTNIDIARQAQEYDYKKWNEMNQYNSPTEQMIRLKEAGLNPNLVYGSGNVTGNSAGQSPKGRTAEFKNELSGVNFSDPLQMLSQYQDIKVKQAQADNIQSNTDLNNVKQINESLRSSLLKLDFDTKDWKLGYNKELAPYQIQSTKAYVSKLQAENASRLFELENILPLKADIMKDDKSLKELEVAINRELKSINMTQGDPIQWRLLAKILNGLPDQIEDQNQKVKKAKEQGKWVLP